MNSFKFSAVAFTIAALGTSALAQNAVGTWNGHIEMGKLPIPPNATPQQRQQAEAGLAMVKKMVIVLTLKKDKSYSVLINGFGQNQTETGNWSQAGKTLTLTSAKKRGGMDKQAATLSADGKTLTIVPPAGPGGPKGMKMVFKKK
jgi:hypothetical protein